jgi:hypothetical protein
MSLTYDPGTGAGRSQDVRIIVNIPASFSVTSRSGGGARPVFACRAVNLSPRTVALTSPVKVEKGDKVLAIIDHLGKLEGEVSSSLEGGFVMTVTATDEEREKLWRKIEWLELHKNLDVSDKRTSRRYVPQNPRAQMILSDGRVERCHILDVSVSGAAIAVEQAPEIGSVLAIGSVVGRVVRHFDGGFGMKFIESLSEDDVAALVARA